MDQYQGHLRDNVAYGFGVRCLGLILDSKAHVALRLSILRGLLDASDRMIECISGCIEVGGSFEGRHLYILKS